VAAAQRALRHAPDDTEAQLEYVLVRADTFRRDGFCTRESSGSRFWPDSVGTATGTGLARGARMSRCRGATT
jgi:hypothetical protein